MGGWDAEDPQANTQRIDQGIYQGIHGGDNMKEGVLSFVEKRKAVYKDNCCTQPSAEGRQLQVTLHKPPPSPLKPLTSVVAQARPSTMDVFHLAPQTAQHAIVSEPRGTPKGTSSQGTHSRPASPLMAPVIPPPDPSRRARKLVLCFDGTGNKFHGDDSDSNILKIFRMLDRTADDQYHYYQPGIGTYVVSGSLSHTSLRARLNSWYQKAKDSAIGSSFDQHVVGGYRFLMRFYSPGDEIYMFGFSRGAYIARFLAEMLDHIGLLSHGNEEMVKFAWKAFAQWQSREMNTGNDKDAADAREKRDEMFRFMKGFRETFSRPVGRIRFLGLFDTVNSVPRFEAAWMQRSKFPYTARSSARVIRHAVSIDERRAKFRQDLMYQTSPGQTHRRHRHLGEVLEDLKGDLKGTANGANGDHERGRQPSQFLTPEDGREAKSPERDATTYAPYRARSKSCQRTHAAPLGEFDTLSNMSAIPVSDIDPEDDGQDIDEVWFSGGHADVGGGWEVLSDSKTSSHVPLAWMVREAMRAGLPFDDDKVTEMSCSCSTASVWDGSDARQQQRGIRAVIPDIRVANGNGEATLSPAMPASPDENPDENDEADGPDDHVASFHDTMHRASTARIHDSLAYGQGLSTVAVSAWKFMEYLPFRRMDLQGDGSWRPIRWPLPRGEVRDVPEAVRVHGSVIRRMKADDTYGRGI
ncbi:hypothetical protein G7046_g3896 [Stylonectria norvegica]|nr:hypothetical protein G7046_g3896 [Stylonectria norvegica]